MKRILLLSIALTIVANTFAQFDLRFTVPFGYFMEDVFFPDSNTTLISGGNLYVTSLDGMKNWHGLSSGGMSVKATYYPSNRFGIAVGDDGKFRINNECAYFWGWENITYIGVPQDLKDAYFINEQEGIVCGDAGTLLKTNNQTASWSSIETPTTANLYGVHMLNDSLAFVCGEDGLVHKLQHDSVYSSQTIDASVVFSKIYFVSNTKGFVLGSGGKIYKTEDQGDTWNSIDLGITDNLLNIDFYNEDHGSVCGTNGSIFTTFDGGDTWQEAQTVPTDPIKSIAYQNQNEALAIGSSFTLYTDDGGLTWTRINGDMRSVHFPTEMNGYACGFFGVAFRTQDGGNNWEAMNLNTPQYLNDVYFLNADTGYVVGGHEIFRTLDGGDNWTAIDNPTTGSLYGVHFTDYYHGVAVGYRQGIMYTDDAGETWDYDYNWDSSSWFLDIQFTSEDTGYFCASYGAMYKTINGGEDWTYQSTGDNVGLSEIFFLNDDVGWAVGTAGKIVKTINGGEDWVSQSSGVDTYLGGVEFFNADTGIVVGSDGTYILTYDGGDTWLDYSNGYFDWSDLSISPNGTAFATAGTSVSAISSFNVASMSYARCAGDRIYYNAQTPYFNNDETHTVVVEMTSEEDDYSNAIQLLTLDIDSIALVDAYLPDGLPEGVYKYRLRDINDSSWTSFDRYFKMTTTPELSLSLVDSILYISSDQEVQLAIYFRASPNESGYYIGNTDSIQIPGTGEVFIQGYHDCCDATIKWTMIGECNGTLILQDEFVVENEYSICNGDSILIAGTYYNEEGVYRDSLINVAGCDSVLISTISIIMPDSIPLSASICSNETYQVGNSIYYEEGEYIDTLISINGCDSIVYLSLTVHEAYTIAIDSSICLGDSVLIGNSTYFEPGSYIDSLSSTNGCDSIINLQLTVYFQGDSIQDFAICEGDSIVVGSSVYTDEGNYIDSIINPIGCLSVYYTYVSISNNPIVNLGSDTTICQDQSLVLDAGEGYSSYLWNTEELSQTIIVSDSAMYYVEVEDENGCIGSDTIQVLVSACTSINELEDEYGIRIFPNPSSGHFNIESLNAVDVKIYSSDGALIQSINNIQGSQNIDIEDSGIFFIHLFEEGLFLYSYPIIISK